MEQLLTGGGVLVLLKELPMDPAWADGVDCAWVELHRMASGTFMEKWTQEVSNRGDELAAAIAQVVVKEGVVLGAKVVLGHAAVASAPISLTVSLIVLTVSDAIGEVVDFWSNLRSATAAAQIYVQLYSYPSHNQTLKQENLEFAKLAFYQSLLNAAKTDDEFLTNLGQSSPHDSLHDITELRDFALNEILETAWSPDEDLNHLLFEDTALGARLTGPFSSDGETAWIGIKGNDRDMRGDQNWLLSYDLKERSENYRRIRFQGDDVYGPKGLWVDETDGTMWFTHDWARSEDIFVYETGTRLLFRDSEKEFDHTISSILERSGNESPKGIWSDKETIWVADSDDAKIYAYNFSAGAREEGNEFNSLKDAGNESPHGIWSDGQTMWVADSEDGIVYAYDMANKARDPLRDIDTVRAPGVAGQQASGRNLVGRGDDVGSGLEWQTLRLRHDWQAPQPGSGAASAERRPGYRAGLGQAKRRRRFKRHRLYRPGGQGRRTVAYPGG